MYGLRPAAPLLVWTGGQKYSRVELRENPKTKEKEDERRREKGREKGQRKVEKARKQFNQRKGEG